MKYSVCRYTGLGDADPRVSDWFTDYLWAWKEAGRWRRNNPGNIYIVCPDTVPPNDPFLRRAHA